MLHSFFLAAHFEQLTPNAGPQAPPEAEATEERRLEAVACRPMFGADGPGTLGSPTRPSLVTPIECIQLCVGVGMLKHQRGARLHPQEDGVAHLGLFVLEAIGQDNPRPVLFS